MEARNRRAHLIVPAISAAFGFSIAVPALAFPVLFGLLFAMSLVYLMVSGAVGSRAFGFALIGLVPALGFGGSNGGMLFLATGVQGLLIGWASRRGVSAFRVVILGALPAFALQAALMVSGGYGARQEIYRQQIEKTLGRTLMPGDDSEGDAGLKREQARFVERLTGIYVRMVPAFEVLSALVNAYLVYLLAAVALIRFGRPIKAPPPFGRWRVPENFVYPFVVGLLLLLIGRGALRTLGINLAVALSVGYLVTGLAVVRHFFQTRAVPNFVQVMSFLLLLLVQPFGALFAWVLGLFDIRFNFRRL